MTPRQSLSKEHLPVHTCTPVPPPRRRWPLSSFWTKVAICLFVTIVTVIFGVLIDLTLTNYFTALRSLPGPWHNNHTKPPFPPSTAAPNQPNLITPSYPQSTDRTLRLPRAALPQGHNPLVSPTRVLTPVPTFPTRNNDKTLAKPPPITASSSTSSTSTHNPATTPPPTLDQLWREFLLKHEFPGNSCAEVCALIGSPACLFIDICSEAPDPAETAPMTTITPPTWEEWATIQRPTWLFGPNANKPPPETWDTREVAPVRTNARWDGTRYYTW